MIEQLLLDLRQLTPDDLAADASAGLIAARDNAVNTLSRLTLPGAPRDEDARMAVLGAMSQLHVNGVSALSEVGACIFAAGSGKHPVCQQLPKDTCIAQGGTFRGGPCPGGM
jgi:hypothetical protein